MKRSLLLIFLVSFITTGLICSAYSQENNLTEKKTSNTSSKERYSLPDITSVPWTGDLDGMIRRREIRVLTTYSKTLYFLDHGTQRGVVYDVFRLFDEDLNKKLKNKHVRVHVIIVPVARNELIPALLEGRGDIAMANLTITPERQDKVDFSDPVGRNISEIVVTGINEPPLTSPQDLAGREVYIRQSSSFFESINKLNKELSQAGKQPVKIRLAPEELEVEDILEMVNAGVVPATISDSHIANLWKQVFPKISLYPQATVRTEGQTGWMFRKESPLLKKEINEFLARYPEGSQRRNQILVSYFKHTKFIKEATSKEELDKFYRTIEFFRQYSDQYDMEYLLMVAQGYQESRLNQKAISPMGAIGVMQVTPNTGKSMGVGDIQNMGSNIHAGVKYIRFMMNQYYADEPMTPLNKGLFTFAAYNAGPGRIAQLRREAARRGLNPNVWFNNVELVAAEKIGRETVQYVSNIYKYYLAYKLITEEKENRQKIMQQESR